MIFTHAEPRVVEQPLSRESPGGTIHAMLYRPEQPRDNGVAVVIAAPDGEERSWSVRALVRTARALSGAGCTVLRFDYRGQGESSGEFESSGVRSRIDDLTFACSVLREYTEGPLAVLGVRLGATVAMLAAERLPVVSDLVLWEPVLQPSQYLQQLLRINLTTQMVVHGRVLRDRAVLMDQARAGGLVSVNGFNLSGAFIDDLLMIDVPAAAARTRTSGLILSSGPVDGRLRVIEGWSFVQAACVPFWKEPKLHSNTTPAFLPLTLKRLTAPEGRLGDAP